MNPRTKKRLGLLPKENEQEKQKVLPKYKGDLFQISKSFYIVPTNESGIWQELRVGAQGPRQLPINIPKGTLAVFIEQSRTTTLTRNGTISKCTFRFLVNGRVTNIEPDRAASWKIVAAGSVNETESELD